jgi:hypothetical protein
MISPWGMRGKGIGSAERPLVPAAPRPREPMDQVVDRLVVCAVARPRQPMDQAARAQASGTRRERVAAPPPLSACCRCQ